MTKFIVAVVEDIFFASKIRETAQSLGVRATFAKTTDQLTAALEEKPDLIVVDLHNRKLDPLQVAEIKKGRDDLTGVSLLGFFSHVETDLQRQALASGFDRVVPRSVFSRDLANILQGVDL